MKKTKGVFTLSIFLVLLFFTTVLSISQSMPNQEQQTDMIPANMEQTIKSQIDDDFTLQNVGLKELNVTAEVTRSINMEYYGVVSINDTIKLDNIGNENITYFNYTLPNINVDKLRFIRMKANDSDKQLMTVESSRIYMFNRNINYTTYRVPLLANETVFSPEVFYINVYTEFAYPYEVSIDFKEQILQYTELLYPLINNIGMIESKTTVNKQTPASVEPFLNDTKYLITPTEYVTSNASTGILEWTNFTRDAFNYTQNYEDDLQINIYARSTTVAQTQPGETFAQSTNLIKGEYLHRRIQIDPYGQLIVTETHKIVSLGAKRPEGDPLNKIHPFAINALPIVLPPGVKVLSLYDDMGSLNQRQKINEDGIWEKGAFSLQESAIFTNHLALTVQPRNPLYGGEDMEFTVVYEIPLEDFLYRKKDTTAYSFKTTPSSIFNWTVDEITLDIHLPRGAVYASSNYSSPDPYQYASIGYNKVFKLSKLGFERILSFNFQDFSGSHNVMFAINFNYSRMNLFISWLMLAFVVGLVALTYIGISRFSKRAKEITGQVEEEHIPGNEIKEFVKAYEEKLSVQERIEQTRDKVNARKLTVREGKEILAKLRKRYRNVEEQLRKAKENLAEQGGKYKRTVQEIEIAERKMLENKRNQKQLRHEYRTKKTLTKESYVRLYNEREREIEKLRNSIDSKLIDLRLLLES